MLQSVKITRIIILGLRNADQRSSLHCKIEFERNESVRKIEWIIKIQRTAIFTNSQWIISIFWFWGIWIRYQIMVRMLCDPLKFYIIIFCARVHAFYEGSRLPSIQKLWKQQSKKERWLFHCFNFDRNDNALLSVMHCKHNLNIKHNINCSIELWNDEIILRFPNNMHKQRQSNMTNVVSRQNSFFAQHCHNNFPFCHRYKYEWVYNKI